MTMKALSDELTDRRMPVVYLSHGAPPLADDPIWTDQLAGWSQSMPRPSSVLMVSAHWEAAPVTLGATTQVPLVYDFWGFPEHYYQVQYPAPGAPALAAEVLNLLQAADVDAADDPERGLDHGAYVPLVEMYPEADIPVLQISMPTLDPQSLFDVGAALAPLRDQGVLIVGSGFATHNLRAMNWHLGPDSDPPEWSAEFDHWLDEAVARGDVDSVIDFERQAPAARIAHPRTEHFAPLFVALGAAASAPQGTTVVDGFWFGLSKRSVQFG